MESEKRKQEEDYSSEQKGKASPSLLLGQEKLILVMRNKQTYRIRVTVGFPI